MSLSSPSQVSADSVDGAGLSVAVAARRADDSRYGTAYDIATMAGAVPVHFHPLTPTEYLMLYSRRWHTATLAAESPAYYSAYSEDTTPGWARIQVPGGQRLPVGIDYTIPTRATYDSAELIDAVSRSNEYLYVLTKVTTGSSDTGLVSHWFYNTTTASITEIAEEEVPVVYHRPDHITERAWNGMTEAERQSDGETVTFTRGLWFNSPYLIVFGTNTAGQLFMARKPWGRIGTNIVARPGEPMRGGVASTAEDPRWTFWMGTGWTIDRYTPVPVADSSGNTIVSLGPVSVATFRDRTMLSTVIANDTARVAKVYSQRGTRPWEPQDGTVPLGSVADDTYLDTLRWQQQVPPSLTAAQMTDDANEVALPYVVSTRKTQELPLPPDAPQDAVPDVISSLDNNWALWSVVRPVRPVAVVGTPLDGVLSATIAAEVEMDVTQNVTP